MRTSARIRNIALLATLMLAGCATFQKEPATTPAGPTASAPLPSGTVGEGLVTATATVKKIDLKQRMVTLERAGGPPLTFRVDESVRNLPQVKVGDLVNVTYYESLAYAVKKPGQAEPGGTVAEELRRAAPGEKPGGAAARVVTLTATIAAIDKAAGTVTLRDTDGSETIIKARDPRNLERVSVGDLVEITYTEALAIAVEKPVKR